VWFVFSMILLPAITILLLFEAWFAKLTDRALWMLRPFFNANTSTKKRFHSLLARYKHPSRFKEDIFRELKKNSIQIKTSFANALFVRHFFQSDEQLPDWKIDEKSAGLRFGRMLGVRIPVSLQSNVPFEKIIPVGGTVVKPVLGCAGTGVFLVKTMEDITELKTGRILRSWAQLKARVSQILAERKVPFDAWMVEEFIFDASGNIPVDLKFNAFYGRIGWVTEIRRPPDIRFHFMDGEGKTIKEGLFRKKELFVGEGIRREEIALAERISLEIPVPFMRIDFLRGVDGLVLNEFTPRPGSTGYMNETWDSHFGRMYHEAEARLLNDLLSGKRFDTFKKATSKTRVK